MTSAYEHALQQPVVEADVLQQDHTTDAVPLSERRDSLTMGLLWVTMVTGFPSVLVGFAWYGAGVSLAQLISCALISCLLVMFYTVPSSLLGSRSGLTYALLSRKVFGRWGSWVVSLNLVWICLAWYGLTAVFMASGLEGLYHWHLSRFWFSTAIAIAMAFNNFFGFSGVANFARYLAGPVLVVWVGLTFCKAIGGFTPAVLFEPAHASNPLALTLVSSFVIGYSVWGNEADYWRYGKPNKRSIVIPVAVALLIGEILFPITGWLLARATSITSYSGATALMNQYAFGGYSFIAALVLFVTYFAINDSTLYGAINALQNVHPIPRRRMVAFLAITGSLAAGLLSGIANNFEDVASVSCIFLPSATIIILAEQLLISKLHLKAGELSRVPSFDELPACRWTAVIALILGCSAGVITSGMLPGTQALHFGVPALHAWLTSFISYWLMRSWQERQKDMQRQEVS